MSVYAMSEFDTLDMLANSASIEKVEFGVVVADQFGLGLKRKGKTGSHLLSGQNTNLALTQLQAAQGAEIVVFYGRGWLAGREVMLPTEMGISSPDVEAAAEMRLQRLAGPQPAFDYGKPNIWF